MIRKNYKIAIFSLTLGLVLVFINIFTSESHAVSYSCANINNSYSATTYTCVKEDLYGKQKKCVADTDSYSRVCGGHPNIGYPDNLCSGSGADVAACVSYKRNSQTCFVYYDEVAESELCQISGGGATYSTEGCTCQCIPDNVNCTGKCGYISRGCGLTQYCGSCTTPPPPP